MAVLLAILQGIIQGLTEFLPISSSGHLSLFQHFTGQSGEGALFFTVMLHLGTLFAVMLVYFKTLMEMIAEFFRMIWDIITGKFRYKEAGETRKMVIMIILSLVPLLAAYLLKDVFTALAEDNDILVEGVCFLFTGSMLFIADRCVKGKKTALKMKTTDALAIGFFQGVAGLPGVSRSGSTISSGILCGLTTDFAVQFSFIMGIPVMLVTSAMEMRDALKSDIVIDAIPLLAGIVTSFVVGLGAIKLIKWLVKSGRFAIFAYYTLTLGMLVIIVGIIELIIGANIVTLF